MSSSEHTRHALPEVVDAITAAVLKGLTEKGLVVPSAPRGQDTGGVGPGSGPNGPSSEPSLEGAKPEKRPGIGERPADGLEGLPPAKKARPAEEEPLLLPDGDIGDVGEGDEEDEGESTLFGKYAFHEETFKTGGFTERIEFLGAKPADHVLRGVDLGMSPTPDASQAQIELLEAAARGDENGVKSLLQEKNINPNWTNRPDKVSPLMLASFAGHHAVVECLLADPRTNINAFDQSKTTALTWAAGEGQSQVVYILLRASRAAGMNILKPQKGGISALHASIQAEQAAVVKLLQQAGAIENPDNNDAENAVSLMQLLFGSSEQSEVSAVSELTAPKEEEVPLLLDAARRNDLRLLEERLAAGDNPNRAARNGQTALHVATFLWHAKIVERLLKCPGIDPNLVTSSLWGKPPLLTACLVGSAPIASLFLAHPGIDVNWGSHWLPLHTALKFGSLEVASVLLAHPGIAVNTLDPSGRTALHVAIADGNAAAVKLVLAYPGVDVNLPNVIKELPKDDKDLQVKVAVLSLIESVAKINRPGITAQLKRLLLALDKIQKLLQQPQRAGRETPLYTACKEKNYEIVKLLLATPGIDVNKPDVNGNTPLHVACNTGSTEIVRLLLKSGADVHAVQSEGGTALHFACQGGHVEIVKLLREFNATVQAGSEHSDSRCDPLGVACVSGNQDVIRELLKFPSLDINHVTIDLRTVLSHACSAHAFDIVRILLSHPSIDVNKADNDDGATPLGLASRNGDTEIVRLLLDHIAIDVNKPDFKGHTALYHACYKGHGEIVELLLGRKADVNAASVAGDTPLSAASYKGRTDIIKILMRTPGVKPNTRSLDGFTPLHTACQRNQVDVVNLFVKEHSHLLDVNLADNLGFTPLHAAAVLGHSAIVQILCDLGANVNTPNANGFSPLHSAAAHGHVEVLDILIKSDAEINQPQHEGGTPLTLACQNGHAKVVEKLLLAGADVNATPNPATKVSPLGAALEKENVECLKLLLGHKSLDVNKTAAGGNTPLHLAVKSGKAKLVRALLGHASINVNKTDTFGRSALYVAAKAQDSAIVKELLEHRDLDLNQPDHDNLSALYAVCNSKLQKGVPIAKMLLQRGAHTRSRTTLGLTAIDLAKDNPSIASMIREHNQKADQLAAAIRKGDADSVAQLALQVHPDSDTDEGWTPLLLAIEQPHIVRILLAAPLPANPNALAGPGRSTRPLHYAVTKNQIESAKELLRIGARVEERDHRGRTALELATSDEMRQMLQQWSQKEAHDGTVAVSADHRAKDRTLERQVVELQKQNAELLERLRRAEAATAASVGPAQAPSGAPSSVTWDAYLGRLKTFWAEPGVRTLIRDRWNASPQQLPALPPFANVDELANYFTIHPPLRKHLLNLMKTHGLQPFRKEELDQLILEASKY